MSLGRPKVLTPRHDWCAKKISACFTPSVSAPAAQAWMKRAEVFQQFEGLFDAQGPTKLFVCFQVSLLNM